MKKKDLRELPESMNTMETLLHGVGQRLDVLIDLLEKDNVPRETEKKEAPKAEAKAENVSRETKEEKPKAKAKSSRKKTAKE